MTMWTGGKVEMMRKKEARDENDFTGWQLLPV